MEHSNENILENQISEEVKDQRSFTIRILIAVIALVFVGVAIYLSTTTSEPRIMAPGPTGSTDSITQPLE